jgi:hypothetical protein
MPRTKVSQSMSHGALPFLSLAVPTETSATELNYWDPPLTSRPLLLPLASLHATPTQPRRRHAWSHYCARISPSPPLPQSASASQQNREKFVPSLSPPLSAPQIDPHSPSPEHTRVSDNYKKGCVATPSSSLRWLTSSCLGLKELSHSHPLPLLSQRLRLRLHPRPRPRPPFCLLLKQSSV